MDWEFIFILSLPWEQGKKRQWGRNVYKGKENPDSRLLFSIKERKWSRSVVSDSLQPHGLLPIRLFCPWDFPGKKTGVGCHFLHGMRKFWASQRAWDLEQDKWIAQPETVVILQMAAVQDDGDKSWRSRVRQTAENGGQVGNITKYSEGYRTVLRTVCVCVCVCICVCLCMCVCMCVRGYLPW